MMKFVILLLVSHNLVSQTESSEPSGTYMKCPFNWLFFQGKCYIYVGLPRSPADATSYCGRSRNGVLATIDSAEKHQFLVTDITAGRDTAGGTYIGLHSTDTTDWRWYDTGVYNISTWSNWRNPPVAQAAGQVVFLHKGTGYTWVPSKSTPGKKFICQCDPDNVTLAELFPLCPYGYQYTYNNKCYGLLHQRVGWDDAEALCQCTGHHLVNVGNQDEYDFLVPYVYERHGRSWIGLRRQDNGSLVYSDGGSYGFSPNHGSMGEGPGSPCVTIATGLQGQFKAKNCGIMEWPLCEAPQYQPSKQAVCLEGHTDYSSLFDGNATTCKEPPQSGYYNLVEIKKECLNNCFNEEGYEDAVRVVVTLDNADSCYGIPIYYQDVLDCGKPYLMICDLVADHLAEFSQCELLCHCHNSTTQECNLFMKKPTNSMPAGYSLCEVNLV